MSGAWGLLFIMFLGLLLAAFELAALGVIGIIEGVRASKAKKKWKEGKK